MIKFENSWDDILQDEFKKDYYLKLRSFLAAEYKQFTIFPSMYDIFNALKLTPFEDVRVVIFGQDPYFGEGQAHGLCFSVPDDITTPPSLRNIFKEIQTDLGIDCKSNYLKKWATQGVLLLNAVLTVRANEPNSHKNKGWEQFTSRVVESLNEKKSPVVFMLWGQNAKSKKALITNPSHLILEAAHPSPLSAYNGFFDCKHFSLANNFLQKNNLPAIDWST